MLANKNKLLKLALSEKIYKKWQNKIQSKILPPVSINTITIHSSAKIAHEIILQDVTTKTGSEFDIRQFNNDVTDIYRRGDYSYVDYEIIPKGDGADTILGKLLISYGQNSLDQNSFYLTVGLKF